MLAHSLPQAPTTTARHTGPLPQQAKTAPLALQPKPQAAPPPDAGPAALYQRLRQQLLQEVLRHRASGRVQGVVGEAHRMHRRTCQRQLGALRQAYRRTQEAAAWAAYAQARGARPKR